MYYKKPSMNLSDGSVMISFDHNMLNMVSCHHGETIFVLYLVSFVESNASDLDCDEEYVEEEEKERCRLGINDPFWQ